MKAVLLCGLAKLRRKKIPFFLLGSCILITAALLVNALILLHDLTAVYDRAYEKMDGPHLCCLWSHETIPTDTVRQYLDSLPNTFTWQITENTKTVEYMEKDGVRLANGILLELPKTAADQDMLSPRIPEGETLTIPGKHEIWITAKMANILHLNTGDDITLQLADQSVQARVVQIVADPVYGGSSTNVYRMWCGYGLLADFPAAKNNAVSYLEIRFDEYNRQAEQNFIRRTEEYFRMPLGNALYTYDQIKSGYTAPWRLIGAIFCLVSIILAVTVILLTLFLIKSDMEEDIRSIGIYKSMGMTGAQLAGIFLFCYGTLAFLSAGLGSVLGGWLNRAILTGILGDIGIYTVSFAKTGGCQLFVWLALQSAVMTLCFCLSFRTRTLNASRAVRTGALLTAQRNGKRPKSACCNGRISFSLHYAVRGIRTRKVRYAFIAGVSLILGCLSVLCLGSLYAVQNIDREPELWGFLDTDIYVTSLEDIPVSAILSELEKEPQVAYAYGVNKISSQYKPGHLDTWQSIVTELYELPWNDHIKDRSLYGRRPMKENEIGIGLTLAEKYGLQVGESIELTVNGEKRSYEITGIFQTLSSYGNVIRMVTENLDQFTRANDTYGDYMLVLSKGIDKWEYARELAERYDGSFSFIASKSNGENISGILAPAVKTVLTVLLAITVLVTMNLTFLLVRQEQGMIGLLKAIGMTSRQIAAIYLWRNCLSAFAGNSLGVLAGIWIVPGLLTPFARSLGLAAFPFTASLPGTVESLLLLPVCICAATCFILKAINAISIRQLVCE